MPILLELANGKYAGRSKRLEFGSDCRAGTKFGLEFGIPDDPSLGSTHFSCVVTKKGVEIFALEGNQVKLVGGGPPVPHQVAQAGDWFVAGESIFRLTQMDAPIGANPATPLDQAAVVLNRIPDLYAMVDVRDDPEWKARLEGGADPGAPIAEGFTQQELAGGEPWLLQATGNLALILGVVRRAWGHGRAAFFRSSFQFESVRQFCWTKSKGKASRFYDPRWLRVALRALPAEEAAEWAGPVHEFVVEANLPQIMERWTLKPSEKPSLQRLELLPAPDSKLPSVTQITNGMDASKPLDAEAAKWAGTTPERASQLLAQGTQLGLTSPALLIQYAVVQTENGSEGGKALDQKLGQQPTQAAQLLDAFVKAANRRRQGGYVPA